MAFTHRGCQAGLFQQLAAGYACNGGAMGMPQKVPGYVLSFDHSTRLGVINAPNIANEVHFFEGTGLNLIPGTEAGAQGLFGSPAVENDLGKQWKPMTKAFKSHSERWISMTCAAFSM